MKLRKAWELIYPDDVWLFIDGEPFAGINKTEVEKEIEENNLWDIEVIGFSTFNGYLKIIAYDLPEVD